MSLTKIQFFTDDITVAVVDDMIKRYEGRAKKTEVYSRLMMLGVQVVNDLGLDLSDEVAIGKLALQTLIIDHEDYRKDDARVDWETDRDKLYNMANDMVAEFREMRGES